MSPNANFTIPEPKSRMLQVFAFDPSLSTDLDTAVINKLTLNVPWEKLASGPVGEYLEVVDIDPPSGNFYPPVDLDHPHLLVQDGLSPSEGTPQFHQQINAGRGDRYGNVVRGIRLEPSIAFSVGA